MTRKAFLIYNDYLEQMSKLTDAQAGKVLKALIEYSSTGLAPQLTGVAEIAFSFMKSQLDRDGDRYDKSIKNGKLGGRPRKHPLLANEAEEDEETDDEICDFISDDCNEMVNKNPLCNETVNENPLNINVNANTKEKENANTSSSAFEELPLAGAGVYEVTAEDILYYKRQYPACDVESEVRQMRGWLDANPDRRKPKSDMKRFITGWLSRSKKEQSEVRNSSASSAVRGSVYKLNLADIKAKVNAIREEEGGDTA